ncbi:hypothetical protein [Actinokineospora sp. NBRC 105648]|uniref:hypothetical protein n=1 Tax=Actinokineospora sp. NBRC 105648 TaxID=3032206 RepID=UPI0024A24901|nr:hypothetical protein [Actinokineospora sp. NBRC 105648]GLZ42888.1 hypothetical protein Acsp05_65120 [Actinokineospora sp. NBRC 105648]
MRCTDAMRVLLGTVDLASVGLSDVPPGWMADAVRQGWTVEPDGAVVATALRASYAGHRSAFSDRTDYEAAVNGRGMVDYDIPLDHQDRRTIVVRRSWAYLTSMLAPAHGTALVTGQVSIGLSRTENPFWEAHVTFWTDRDDEPPYYNLDTVPQEDAVLQMRADDPLVRA